MLKCVICGKGFNRHSLQKRKTCSAECFEILRLNIAKKYHLRFNDRLSWNKTRVNYPIEEKYLYKAQELVKKWGLPEM